MLLLDIRHPSLYNVGAGPKNMTLRTLADEDFGLSDPIYIRICQKIRTDILSGVFAPGQRLKVADLSQRYRVSQMPIREALQQLQGEWLVTILPNRGASVRKVDESFIDQMYEIRGHLESLLTRRCAERATAEDLVHIEAAYKNWISQAESIDLAGSLNANWKLHRTIYEAADNLVGMELLERHFGLLQALRSTYGFGDARLQMVKAEHEEIMAAIRAKDGPRAELAARQHCENARRDLLQRMKGGSSTA
jgi:DNA-binding GntR family transcriptional regulator